MRAVVFGTITQAMSREKAEQDKLIKEYELRRKAKAVVVPTDDAKVRTLLRQMGEPITLFGEKEVRTQLQRPQLTGALRHRETRSSAAAGRRLVA